MKTAEVWSNRWETVAVALCMMALLVFAFGPDNKAWNQVAWIAACSGLFLDWGTAKYGPKSASADDVLHGAIVFTALLCVANRLWLALR